MLLTSLTVCAQEEEGKISFDSGIFAGESSAYVKCSASIFFENVYVELDKPVGNIADQFGLGFNVGLTFACFRFRPWLDENMFSIGWGFEIGKTKSRQRVMFSDGRMTFEPFPAEWERPKSWLTTTKFTVPLTYARDFDHCWRFFTSITPAIATTGYNDDFKTAEKWAVITNSQRVYFDCDFSIGINYNDMVGLYLKYKPNFHWRSACNADIRSISFGFIVTH